MADDYPSCGLSTLNPPVDIHQVQNDIYPQEPPESGGIIRRHD
jgi:hypothetical protein